MLCLWFTYFSDYLILLFSSVVPITPQTLPHFLVNQVKWWLTLEDSWWADPSCVPELVSHPPTVHTLGFVIKNCDEAHLGITLPSPLTSDVTM